MGAQFRIYVADLAAYNSEDLRGEWIDLSSDAVEVQEKIQAFLKAGGAEEFAIHDYELGGVRAMENTSIETFCEFVGFVEETQERLGEEDGETVALAIAKYSGLCRPKWLEAAKEMRESFDGIYDSAKEWAEENFFERFQDVPEAVKPYVDVEMWLRDLDCNSNFTVVNVSGGRVAIFLS